MAPAAAAAAAAALRPALSRPARPPPAPSRPWQAKWLAFANGQRVHYNYVEGVATSILLTLVAGLYQPVWAARLGALYIAGREVFALGYAARGPSGRMYGAVLFDVALVGLLGLAAHGAYAHTQA